MSSLVNDKPVILLFVRYYLPGYLAGGPIRTISNLVEKLGNDYKFMIVTSDRDSGSKSAYSSIKENQWSIVGKAEVFYASPEWLKMRKLLQLLRNIDHDIVYINTFYHPIFGLSVLLAYKWVYGSNKPMILAPRGQLAVGARSLKKMKKSLYIYLLKISGVLHNICWQASSKYEAEDIRNVIGSIAKNIIIAPDLSLVKNDLFYLDQKNTNTNTNTNNVLSIIFLARISPVKNLDVALHILSQVKVPVIFSIYGSIEDAGYWNDCCRLIDILPSNIEVKYQGSISPNATLGILAQHDLFFLPTRGESYGHSIAESLAAGTPVLISDATPWEWVNEKGIGWTVALDDQDAFVKRIHCFSQLTPKKKWNLRERVLRKARGILEKQEDIDANKKMFLSLLDAR
jgi:glycosyltransferase involved in cell wall biosynthesis